MKRELKTRRRYPRRLVPRATVQVDAYKVIARAVEEGVTYGWNRAHKHTTSPSESLVKETIESAVMNALCEVIMWPNFGSHQ